MQKPDDVSPEVLRWLQLAAGQGEHQALYNLGVSYHRGDFGSPDIHKSGWLYRKSSERHYGPASARLAMIYANGDKEIPADKTLARYFALKGTLERDNNAHTVLMQLATEEEKKCGRIDPNPIIESAIEAGEPMAALDKYVSLLKEDNGNLTLAITELEKFSDSDCRLVDETLGILYLEMKDYEKALMHFTKAAEDGHVYAQVYLAEMYYEGKGVEKDVAKALEWVEKSLNFGNNDARRLFARMIMSNDLKDLLPDKVLRGPAYLELSNCNKTQKSNG